MPSLIFRKGLDLKGAVAGMLAENYHSDDRRAHQGRRLTRIAPAGSPFTSPASSGSVTASIAPSTTPTRPDSAFPTAPCYLTGEIIHNPHVNDKLRSMGIALSHRRRRGQLERLGPDDVVILPAFGVTVAMLQQLERRGCTLVDTTCGSVLNVWKNVRRYCEGGYTSIIHGKAWHEETQATASQAVEHGGRYLVVFNHDEAQTVCDYIRARRRRDAFLDAVRQSATSEGFDPDRDLQRIGLANQTTMLMSESLEIGEMLKAAMIDRFGDAALTDHFQAFDTICSATQDRQDAVHALLEQAGDRPDARDRRLQQQQYLQPGPDLRRVVPDLPHRRPDLPGLVRGDSPSAGWGFDRGHHPRVAAERTDHGRSDVRRLDA